MSFRRGPIFSIISIHLCKLKGEYSSFSLVSLVVIRFFLRKIRDVSNFWHLLPTTT